MPQKPETRLVNAIRKALQDRYGATGKWIKIHGSAMQESGLPDIIGCLGGRFLGIEVKMPGEEPTPLQQHRLAEIAYAGGIASYVESVDQALELAAAVLLSSVQSSS